MMLRYVSAKRPESLSIYMGRLKGLRISIVSGPVFAKNRWYLWFTADTGQNLPNIDLED